MRAPALLVLVGLAACGGSTSPAPAFRDVAAEVEARAGAKPTWNRGTDDDREVEAAVDRLLEHEISADQAVAIALIENRSLQATYEDLSLAQADFVQAGLLKNPTLSGGVGFFGGPAPILEAGVGWDFLDLFSRAARRKIAAAELEGAKRRVGDAVLRAVAETRSAYVTLQGAMQIEAMRGVVADAAEAGAELSRRQHDAGNISDLDLANEETGLAQVKLDLGRAHADTLAARERLIRDLGLWGVHRPLRVPAELPDVPSDELPLEALEQTAIAQRFDVAAARSDRDAAAMALSLAKQTRWVPGANVGASYERNTIEHETIVGPTAAIEVPVFDRRQATIARLEALDRASEARLRALAVDARSEVRSVRDRLVYLRDLARTYKTELIPLRERTVALSQQQYDAMLLGVFQLLAAKQAEVNAYREYLETVRDYWIARAELERAVGGRIVGKVTR